MLEVVADRFPDPAELFFGLINKTVGKVLYQPGTCRCEEQLTQVVQSALKLLGVGEKSKSAGQGDRPTQFKKQFEGVGNVGLRLAFEESLVTALTETGSGVHDKLGVGAEGNVAVPSEVEAMRRAELARRRGGAYFELNQVVDPTVMRRHRLERFPVHTLFIYAQAAPSRFVAKDLVRELVDAGSRLARTGVARDEPAATELAPLPPETLETGDDPSLRFRHKQCERGK